MVLSQIYLLIGFSIPVWLWYYIILHCNANMITSKKLYVLKHMGWISVGLGDSMGALWGTLFGKITWNRIAIYLFNAEKSISKKTLRRIQVSGRTLEGSCACLVSMVLGKNVMLVL